VRLPALQVGELRTSGIALDPGSGQASLLRIERLEARDLTLHAAFGSASLASATLSGVTVRLRDTMHGATATERLSGVAIGELRLEGARAEIESVSPRTTARTARSWQLAPLAALDGTLHANITDAAWIFDAAVTIPISRGRVDFNRATVEHIGPDSSMGVSRMGVYVDAPTGRHYLYLLSATHIPGASFERRGGLLPFAGADRGSIEIAPFINGWLAGVPLGTLAAGIRDMLARTRLSGSFLPGDGAIGEDRVRVVLTGRAQGANRVELSSASPDPGVVLRIAALSAAESQIEHLGARISTGPVSGALSVQLTHAPHRARVVASIAELTLRDVVYGDRPDPMHTRPGIA
jgi:hypothetical protein